MRRNPITHTPSKEMYSSFCLLIAVPRSQKQAVAFEGRVNSIAANDVGYSEIRHINYRDYVRTPAGWPSVRLASPKRVATVSSMP